MEIRLANNYINRLIKKHKLDCTVRWSNVAVGYIGQYVFVDNQIVLSRKNIFFMNKSDVYDMLKHEIAHVLDYKIRGHSCHDKNWKHIAELVGCKDLDISFTLTKRQSSKIFKFHYYCPKCKHFEFASRRKKNNTNCLKCDTPLQIKAKK